MPIGCKLHLTRRNQTNHSRRQPAGCAKVRGQRDDAGGAAIEHCKRKVRVLVRKQERVRRNRQIRIIPNDLVGDPKGCRCGPQRPKGGPISDGLVVQWPAADHEPRVCQHLAPGAVDAATRGTSGGHDRFQVFANHERAETMAIMANPVQPFGERAKNFESFEGVRIATVRGPRADAQGVTSRQGRSRVCRCNRRRNDDHGREVGHARVAQRVLDCPRAE